jgi:hypothetical protein
MTRVAGCEWYRIVCWPATAARARGRSITVPTTNPAHRPGARSGYVPVNGLDMYYEIHGDGFPLARLHGAMGTIDSCFADLLPALAAARQVVAIDCRAWPYC